MQFLQAGLDRGERCLFISTEQTVAEIRDSFEDFSFGLDHEGLSLATVHAGEGTTLEGGADQLVIESLGTESDAWGEGGTETGMGGHAVPFSWQYVREFVRSHRPADRVVFDSISGLSVMTADEHRFRRFVLDLIRLFTDEFGATTLFLAEEDLAGESHADLVSHNMLQFNTHGVVNLWREQVDRDYRRHLQVSKMRGVDHATRQFEVEIAPDGLHVGPLMRTPSPAFLPFEVVSSGIEGLDSLCGGGFVRGGTTLVEHDGRADVLGFVSNAIVERIDEGGVVVLLPPANLSPEKLDRVLDGRVGSVDHLLATDRLFVLDLVGTWRDRGPNVYTLPESSRLATQLLTSFKPALSWFLRFVFNRMNDDRDGRPATAVTYTEALLQEFSPTDVRRIHYWGKESLLDDRDSVLFVQNPSVMAEELSESFVYDADQVVRTWLHESGLQYVKLAKSPTGRLGDTRLVEYTDDPPYVRVQQPHRDRDDPSEFR